MTENEKPKNVVFKIWLVFATFVTVIFSSMSGYFTVMLSDLEFWWAIVISIFLLCGILISVYSTWKFNQDGKRRLAIILSVTMVLVSIIQAWALAFLLLIMSIS